MPYSVHEFVLREKEPNPEIFLVRISSVWTEPQKYLNSDTFLLVSGIMSRYNPTA